MQSTIKYKDSSIAIKVDSAEGDNIDKVIDSLVIPCLLSLGFTEETIQSRIKEAADV